MQESSIVDVRLCFKYAADLYKRLTFLRNFSENSWTTFTWLLLYLFYEMPLTIVHRKYLSNIKKEIGGFNARLKN